MTRAEADLLLQEYDNASSEYRVLLRLHQVRNEVVGVAFHRMDACRERLIDRLCGEEATRPLAGNAP